MPVRTSFSTSRLAVLLLAGACLGLPSVLSAPAAAQGSSQGPAAGNTPPAAAPARPGEAPVRKPPRDRRAQLDALFEALRLAPDEQSAKALNSRLDAFFAQTGSPSADLLMARAEVAAQAKEYDLSLELLNVAITIVPDNLSLLARRASVKYAQDDYDGALVDLGEVLTREPRHYTALLGLALILREVGEDARALDAARRALAVNPHLEEAQEIVDELKVDVEGREI
ncbi:tetratricopeptide repeat protein [Aquabacter cavernae]|uniref:tetratricopeptide repeat protein n=1 Tax=Aquabacter cavernae TaxID=2496029 RepID=UPI00196AD6B7|nr:tetratricopeptide repeat protein [Aquabacter cavernae]